MSSLILWRRLTETDFNAMHGEASPHGRGGGAMHIALGVRSTIFPIDTFLNARGRSSVTIATAAQPGNHDPATLTFGSNPSRRGGEWLIRDQYSHRHPAWSSAAGFPTVYNQADPPYVLIFRVDGSFHVRFARASDLSRLPAKVVPAGILSRPKGVQRVNQAFLSALGVPLQTLLETFEEEASQLPSDAFDPRSVPDGRQRILVSILRRQGQQDFRRKLLAAYNRQCAMTRCRVAWILEAAHITPYRGIRTNAVSNGLLLRADIHTLFDLALISIEPARMKIHVSSRVGDPLYAALDGTRPVLPSSKTARSSMIALEEHFSLFQP